MADDDLLADLYRRRDRAAEMGGAAKVARQHQRGSLTARERIGRLLDEGSFFEIGLLNHSDMPGLEERSQADGKVCGLGTIDRRPVMVSADDATVLAGTAGRVGRKKFYRLVQLAIEKGYPIVNLGEAGGARLPDIQGSEGVSSMTIGTTLASRVRRVPMAAAILGECFGAPAWAAAFSDFVVQRKGSCMAVSGPRVLEVATGERVTNEELGGSEVHGRITGLVDRTGEDDHECLRLIREFLSFLPSHAEGMPVVRPVSEDCRPRQARLRTMVPESARQAYDMVEVIRTIVDGELVFPLKPEFGRSVITCLARLDGQSVGIIASQPRVSAGAMGPDECDKCTSFICLCDSFHIPLVFLHDTPGFFVGKAAEHRRLPGKIINFVEALALASVPKISVIIRKSYGMAYSNMAGPAMGADFVFAWPTAEISFMAPEVAANVVDYDRIRSAEDAEAARHEAIERMRLGSAPWRAAGLHYLDDVIAPAETRDVLVRSLDIGRGAKGGRSKRHLATWPTSF